MTYEEIEQQAFKHHRPSARSFGRQVYDIQQARIAELEVELTTIANMAHHGGLINKGSRDIRMALLPYWDKEACAKLQAEPEGSEQRKTGGIRAHPFA